MSRTVLYLHSSAGHYGADRQLALMAGGLDPARYRALVVLPFEGELVDDLRGAGVEVIVAPLAVLRRALMTPPGLARLGSRMAADAARLGRLARRRGVSIVHTNTGVTLGGPTAARIAAAPHVWHAREIFTGYERFWPAYRRLLSRADALVCVSEAVRAQFPDASTAQVIHDGIAVAVDPAGRSAARTELGLAEDGFVCAVLGRISPWKGQDVLARALAEPALAGLGAIALVAGDAWPGEERRERTLRELASSLGLGERLRLLGFRSDPETVLGAADVVVVPSTGPDPFPNSALEAASAGCCVVAAAHGGLPEMLRDGETGVLVAPGDAAALAEALAGLAGDPARREALGRAAAEDVRARFEPERLLDEIQRLYDRLLAD